MIAKLPNKISKAADKVLDLDCKVNCFLEAFEDIYTSKSGVEILEQGLRVMGEVE